VKVCLESSGIGLWKESLVWEPNECTFDNLLRIVSYFDYGVLVATRDDVVQKDDGSVNHMARDNVILEMGLFAGALGKSKSFLLVERGVTLPSDFLGFCLPRFDSLELVSVENACAEIVQSIRTQMSRAPMSFYPTSVLKIGYYSNFLQEIVQQINAAPV
jgi:predicted nucleotide-binding protein